MTDDQKSKRDAAAAEYGANSRHLKTSQHFVDGWDACAKGMAAEIERYKANSLRSFDVAVPSDEWYDTLKERDTLRVQAEQMAEALKEALDHVTEMPEGCLFCGGDEEYVEENGESSEEHKKECWYYKGEALIREFKKEQGNE